MRKRLGAAVAGWVLTAATAVQAVPVTYTVNAGSTFMDSAALSGTFTYDADTNTYSAINLTTAPSFSHPGQTYVAIHAAHSAVNQIVVLTSTGLGTGEPVLFLPWTTALSNVGGVVSMGGGIEGYCNAGCTSFSGALPARSVLAGAVTGVPAPPPVSTIPTLSEWAMILFGLLLAGGAAFRIGRRRSATGRPA